jgi:hypothetical protein
LSASLTVAAQITPLPHGLQKALFFAFNTNATSASEKSVQVAVFTLRHPGPKSSSRGRPIGEAGKDKKAGVMESVKRLAIGCCRFPSRHISRCRQDRLRGVVSSERRRARPRSFTSCASCCMDCCVTTRPSPWVSEALASSSVRRNSVRCRSRSPTKQAPPALICFGVQPSAFNRAPGEGLLIWRKMYVHRLQNTEKPSRPAIFFSGLQRGQLRWA